jgi:hypothetical protein
MTALPTQQPAMFGFNPNWKALAAMFGGGIAGASTPGSNFALGSQQGIQGYEQQQTQQQLAELRKMQIEQAQMEMNRANKEQADLEAAGSQVAALLGGGPSPVRPVGNYGAAVGGAPQPAMFDLTPEQSAILQARAKGDPRGTLDFLTQQAFAEPEAEKLTDDQREYQQGVEQGFQGTFLDWILGQRKAGASVTNVNTNVGSSGIDYGDPPKGLAWARNPDGSVKLDERGAPLALPIQGTPEYLAWQQANQAGANRDAAAAQTTDIVTTDINRALEKIDQAIIPATGAVGGVAQYIPNTNAYDVRALVQTIKGNIGIDKLQAMRMMSPTGGALGNVTEGELATLQATLGNLDQAQSDEQIKYNLKRVHNTYLDIVHGKGNGPKRYDLGKAPAGPEGSSGGELRYDEHGELIQ